MTTKKINKKPDAAVTLGPLETEIMNLMWDAGKATVRDIVRLISKKREIAYTTIMTIMVNLVNKGALKRRRDGKAFVYEPVFTREEFTKNRMARIADNILDQFTEPSMTYLVDRMAQVDPEKLEELEEAIVRLRRKEANQG